MNEWMIILKAIGWVFVFLILCIVIIVLAEYLTNKNKKFKEKLRVIIFNIGYILFAWWSHGWHWDGAEGLMMYWVVIIIGFLFGNVVAIGLYKSKFNSGKE